MRSVTRAQGNLFEGQRLQMTDSIAMTIASLQAYGPRFQHWVTAYSGGKDSTALVTLIIYLILARKTSAPKTLTVVYADTRMEIPALWLAAARIREELEDKAEMLAALGCMLTVRVVMAPLDDRFLVYMLGRGVPPPNNRFRWCTPRLKVQPMLRAVEELRASVGEKLLMLTGVRVGESAARDERIVTSCTRDGAECGQGWFQETVPDAIADTLAPLLHWRVCHVWEWLKHWAPSFEFGDWTTEPLADAYGGDEAEEINARTGCIGCNLVETDKGLEASIRNGWAYTAPLRKLKALWGELIAPAMRLRKPGGERTKAGKLAAKQQRLGPLTFEARRMGLARVLAIQAEVNEEADRLARPQIDILNAEEVARIEELIEARTWPDGWNGTEPTGDAWLDKVLKGGAVQPLLLSPEALSRGSGTHVLEHALIAALDE